MTISNILLVSVIGYLLGAINFAVIVARSQGVDILKVGSGNPGATNVTRALGSKFGKLVFVLDALKGFAAAYWPLLFMNELGLKLAIVGLIASIIGHSFSIFLNFRGGKGVATTMGGLLAIMPSVLLIGILVWCLFFLTSRTVALASILFALSLSVSAYLIYSLGDPRFALALALGVIIIIRHQSNIRNMLKGTENRFKS